MEAEQQRIVVKIGSSSLTNSEGGLNLERLEYYATEIASLQKSGYQMLLVTSGAVAAGFKAIGFDERPRALYEKQASAAVGQALLMRAYQESFARHGIVAAQILLTRADFSERQRVNNALMTIEELLKRGVIPVVNENDTVSVDEIKLKFGDNDKLSALAANLVKACKLLILTDTDGLYTADPRLDTAARRIERVDQINDSIFDIAGGAGTSVGTGGMRSKIEAARIATRGGIPVFVGKAAHPGDLAAACAGHGKGTYFDTALHSLPIKKQWVGFHSIPEGCIHIDQGAATAMLHQGRSLLPAGVTEVNGDFHPGDVVEVADPTGAIIGRGVVNYEAWQLRAAAGFNSDEVKRRVDVHRIEVIHRDEWIGLQP
ncbi:glutamate 5-kinase [Xylanibacillus composti]|uniref:Glutamate 5-kinase n=1 Tax=Xylanibacillus composti TaxID=1572762 RepID=A0A8J4M106_9BACL|nr:glutamate 5-kinase [Xylanibacillus composti]GIQ67610.1 glutamate 5-kinase [Xylanibacillus composti]